MQEKEDNVSDFDEFPAYAVSIKYGQCNGSIIMILMTKVWVCGGGTCHPTGEVLHASNRQCFQKNTTT